jgi:membrane protease YdiL (CAAX protease family)
MSSSDSFPEQPAPEPLDRADVPPLPSSSPLDRPPTDDHAITDRPVAETWAAPAYPDYDREASLVPNPPPGNPLAAWGVLGTIIWWFVRPGRPHPQFWWACLWMLAFMLVTQGLAAVVAVATMLVGIALSPNRQKLMEDMGDPKAMADSPEIAQLMWPGLLASVVLGALFGYTALRLIAGRDWARKVAVRLPSFPHLCLVLLAVPAFVLIGQAVDEIAKQYVPSLFDLDATMGMIGYWPWWLGVLIIGFGPGISEELFCRGFLGRGLVGNHGVVLGVLFTSILFGVMHVEPRQVIYAPVMGIFLHIIYLTTRSLLMPMMVHTINNSLGVLGVWALKSHAGPEWLGAADQASDQPSFVLVYVGAVILMAAAVVGLYISRARLVGADGGPPRWQPAYPGVEYPPPDSGTVVSRPLGLGLAALGIGVIGFLAFVACCFACYAMS